MSTSKGVWDVASVFLQGIGITKDTAERTGEVLATVLQYDESYRLPLVDAMSEFTKDMIVQHPGKFVKKFISILKERSDNNDLINKFEKFTVLFRIVLWFPKYRKAFRNAFRQVDLTLLQYDKYDCFLALDRKGYNAGGMPYAKRREEFERIIQQQ